MIVDDVEGFLEFLNNVSLQLTRLLDIDKHEEVTKKNCVKQKLVGKPKISKLKTSKNSTCAQQKKSRQTKLTSQSIQTKNKKNNIIHDPNPNEQQQGHLSNSINNPNDNYSIELQSNKLQQNLNPNNETHTLDVQLTLSMADELPPFDHGSSISPATHLSPIESSLPFGSIHQHYYTPQRGHIDSYHIHDEFASHDPIPIPTSSPHSNQLEQRNNHYIMSHQQSNIRADSLEIATLNQNADCYSQHHQPQQPQQQQPQQPRQQHQHSQSHQLQSHPQNQFHHLDQQWLGTNAHSSDAALQLGGAESNTLDHVVSLSPVAHQSIEHVQFNANLYHHSYYNSQPDQLDTFHHINNEYPNNSNTLNVGTSSPINQLHRSQSNQHPQQQQIHHQQSQHSEIRLSPLNNHNSTGNSYDQIHLQHHHNHHQQHHNEIQDQHEHHQMNHLGTSYNIHQSNQNHLMPMMNGLESGGVIIQDINLASATWSSPEDLYSI